MLLLFSLVWWRTTFSNFQSTFTLISPKVFGIGYSHQISAQKSEKYDKTFETKIRVGLKKFGGMMLWIMSGTFKVHHLTHINPSILPQGGKMEFLSKKPKLFRYMLWTKLKEAIISTKLKPGGGGWGGVNLILCYHETVWERPD